LDKARAVEMLVGLGLTQLDSLVYLFLSKKGLQKGREIATGLKITKQQLYRSLRNLQSKGIVSSTFEHPARFSVAPIETVLDLFIKAKIEETHRLQQNKEEILSDWQSIAIGENSDSKPKFTVIEGRSSIYPKIQQLIQETQNNVLAVTTVQGLIQADQLGLFDVAFHNPSKSKIQLRFLTKLSQQETEAMRTLLREMTDGCINFEGRTIDDGSELLPRMFIKDEEQILLFITPQSDASIVEQGDACLWTNCKTLVRAFIIMFEESWRNSTDIKRRIAET
jgi:sugar-specific transcriptional regulator TrmB